MAIIKNQELYIKLFPRKYAETGDDPFIASLLHIEIQNTIVFDFYGSLLLESEYEDLLGRMESMLSGSLKRVVLNPVEPYFVLRIEKDYDELYKWVFYNKLGLKRIDGLIVTKEEMVEFHRQLQQEMTGILPPPFLP
ncbi:hypothetical protein A6395_01625 [Exiguobacterium sp. SH31]|uniref:hypothetical protein n=1 Tax=unclassified Exiguobacterium TaxID=2644629 RepID=UPI0008CFF8FD|nr:MULTISPECIES: hypothetical protein [unclassified Exiguobacterium]OGX80407.1 hypothetical protein A6395_01625 [Exiguobacterium sp. SH31]TCI72952.1 hypothetical protein EVJ22_00695 [Exiguobacterium sp. SH0S7]